MTAEEGDGYTYRPDKVFLLREMLEQATDDDNDSPHGDAYERDIKNAREWVVKNCRSDADDALQIGMDTVEILRTMDADLPALYAALLQPCLPLSDKEKKQIAERFGDVVVTLLRGAAHMRQLSALSEASENSRANRRVNDENLRKMLIAMVDDIRVVLIELARHLAELRRCKNADNDTRERLGRVTVEVYAPLANRLGVGQIKWRMEDHALRYLAPDEYRELAAALAETRVARERYIVDFIDEIRAALAAGGVTGEVHGRPKHLYSIWRKMRSKGLDFARLHDLRALRIVTASVADCYAALAIVHAKWRQLPGEFDDYIATPKANGYRSIHTVIIADDKPVEIQIRTHEMHHLSELGVAAHWRYKEKIRADESIDNKVVRLRQLLEWKDELLDGGDDDGNDDDKNVAGENDDVDTESPQRIYVFTPKGTVIDLPAGATPIDFAYAIHSDIGDRIRGAKVDGKMVPLGHALATGEQVQIQTAAAASPSRDWLRADLGFVRTRRAKSRIAGWFKRADYHQNLADGRAQLERELTRLGMESLAYDKIAAATHFHKTDDLLAAIGAGDFKLSRALAPFRRADDKPIATHKTRARRADKPRPPGDLQVSGVDNLLTRMAHCCNPIPGDSITGFITAGRGISIHRRDCANIKNLSEDRQPRLIEVQWGAAADAAYAVEIHLTAAPKSTLLTEISDLLKDQKTPIKNLTTTPKNETAKIKLTIEITNLKKLQEILTGLEKMEDVYEVRRVG